MSVVRTLITTGAVQNDTASSAGIGIMRYELNLNGTAGNGAAGNVPLGEYEKADVRTMLVTFVTDELDSSTTDAGTSIKLQLSNGVDLSDAATVAELNTDEGISIDAYFKRKSTENQKGLRLNIAGGNITGRLSVIIMYLLP